MTQILLKILLLYLLAVNLLGAGAVFLDKWLARHEKRRIRERTLFLWCVLGGCPLVYAAMKLCRHKTLHKRFMIGIPLIFLAQVIAAGALIWYLNSADLWAVSFIVSK